MAVEALPILVHFTLYGSSVWCSILASCFVCPGLFACLYNQGTQFTFTSLVFNPGMWNSVVAYDVPDRYVLELACPSVFYLGI